MKTQSNIGVSKPTNDPTKLDQLVARTDEISSRFGEISLNSMRSLLNLGKIFSFFTVAGFDQTD